MERYMHTDAEGTLKLGPAFAHCLFEVEVDGETGELYVRKVNAPEATIRLVEQLLRQSEKEMASQVRG